MSNMSKGSLNTSVPAKRVGEGEFGKNAVSPGAKDREGSIVVHVLNVKTLTKQCHEQKSMDPKYYNLSESGTMTFHT